MEYTDEFSYAIYLAESTINRSYFKAAVRESILTAQNENTMKNMTILTEGVSEKIKAAINKIIAALTRIWGRFIESMNALIKRDKNYLIQYKDIILKKKFLQNYTFTMYQYQKGQPNLLGTYAPAFNFSSLEPKLVDEETFVGAYFNKIEQIQKQNTDINFAEAVKIYFRGSAAEESISASEFNLTDAYNFCVNYQEITKKVETDSKNIKAAAEQVQQKIEQMAREEKDTGEQSTPTNNGNANTPISTPTSTPTNNGAVGGTNGPTTTPQKESFDFFSVDSYKSFLYNTTIFNEVEISAQGQKPGGASNTPGTKNTTNPSNATINQNGQNNADVNQSDVDKSGGSDSAVKKIELYIKIVGELMTAKCQVLEEMYKNYMQIIRAHVKDHVGSKDKTTDKPEDKATVQGKDNTSEKVNTSGLPG